MTSIDPATLAATLAPEKRSFDASGLVVFFFALLAVMAFLALGVVTLGLPAIAMAALALVPVMFLVLVLLSRG